ncbi:MAG TPA: hypothetical protein VJ842_14335 [Pyrinomonadaceae bacterium]|nr:hypothetical protein [Pyrinomonadaceae bacterium]
MSTRTIVIVAIVIAVLVWSVTPVFAVKAGAILSVKPEIAYARRIVAEIWRAFGYTLTVTSGYDGSHLAQSKHYEGLAEDYRTRDVKPDDLPIMVSRVRDVLGTNYDVVLEPDHLHVEYDPKVQGLRA